MCVCVCVCVCVCDVEGTVHVHEDPTGNKMVLNIVKSTFVGHP